MRHIISWLSSVEDLACFFYEEAARLFSEDKELSHFLIKLSRDEQSHCQIMLKAAEHLRELSEQLSSHITFRELKDQTEKNLIGITKVLSEKNITKDELFDGITLLEFSEYNDVFLYVVNRLTEMGLEFKNVNKDIEQHRQYIKNYLQDHHHGGECPVKGDAIAFEKKEKLLVIDDSQAIVDFIAAIFHDNAIVDSARNGKDAISKMTENSYDVIITDIDNALEFVERACRIDPATARRIIIYSGYTAATSDLFDKYDLRYLEKPAEIGEIKKAVIEVANAQ